MLAAPDHNSQERAAMNQHWIDDLWFSVENYDTESVIAWDCSRVFWNDLQARAF
jgi:hypothetical protein